ncbi:MAG: sigma-54-dependent Fis family transcriptional regulator [Sandaracinaceae bacterium]|nr:sigma-54-dependent Fis family transcriptional regulator [Sandaracinaceae bacterium]
MGERILVVEDEATLRTNLHRYLDKLGHAVTSVGDGEQALELLGGAEHDVVLTDLQLPGVDGLAVLDHARSTSPDTVVLLMTAFGTLSSAVEALRRGAHDYLLKPVSLAAVGAKVQRIAEYRALGRENARLRSMLRDAEAPSSLLHLESAPMRELEAMVQKVAPGLSNVLVRGESGTGKELVARAIHDLSNRADAAFVPVNVSAIPDNLVESTLFGHVRGAFTGAERARDGLFRSAHGGTLFLDEIGELPLPTQAKLLRAVETKEIRPVGSDRGIEVDARIVCATHRDLAAMVETREFREDLLYRLSVVRLDVPALREHPGDIPSLVGRFVAKQAREQKKQVFGVQPDAMQRLMRYRWPGNVRELSNVIERAVLLADAESIRLEDLPAEIRGATLEGDDARLDAALASFERRHIASVLTSCEGNRDAAAKLLAVSPATLYRKLEKLGLKGYRGGASSGGSRS